MSAQDASAISDLPGTIRELHAHVGVAKGEDRAIHVLALGDHELEVAVTILRDAEEGDGAAARIELGQVGLERLGLAAQRAQLVEVDLVVEHRFACGLPLNVVHAVNLTTDRLIHPQTHDVLEIPKAELKAALIGEILLIAFRSGDGLGILNAQQTPRT